MRYTANYQIVAKKSVALIGIDFGEQPGHASTTEKHP